MAKAASPYSRKDSGIELDDRYEKTSFLTLPAEIRTQIWQLVFDPAQSYKDAFQCPRCNENAPSALQEDYWASTYLLPLLTCRQFYQDAHLLAFSRTTFVIRNPYTVLDIAGRINSTLRPAQISSLRSIAIISEARHFRQMHHWKTHAFGIPALQLEDMTIILHRSSYWHYLFDFNVMMTQMLRDFSGVKKICFVRNHARVKPHFHTWFNRFVGAMMRLDRVERFGRKESRAERTWWNWAPMPGAPSSSWALLRQRLSTMFEGVDKRVVGSFWLFGLINNVLYVIILSSALDLVGPAVPKSLVLLFDVVPSFLVKLTAPYYIHLVPYNLRILAFVALSSCGMLFVALSPSSTDPNASNASISVKMLGVILASISSGGGELSFLGLTHFYGPFSLAAWGSGTGGAGLIGSGAYVLATTAIGLSVRTSLFVFSFLPVIMLFSFFFLLPAKPASHSYVAAAQEDVDPDTESLLDDAVDDSRRPTSPKLSQGAQSTETWHNLKANFLRARSLFFPYMLPLLLVYVAEYTINQGVAPTLLFPLDQTPFKHYRSFYPTYNAIYQLGVFISRSSLPFVRIHALYLPSLLQCLNLVILAMHAMFPFVPNIWFVFAITFWEGLLGGIVYVSTFRRIGEEVAEKDREFSLGATSVSDSGGICIAGFVGMAVETGLCRWQVAHGRDWCTRL